MNTTPTKSDLYEQVARIGKALSSPKRLELIELLAQGEKPVELLARQSRMDMRLTSAHLKALREARLVETRSGDIVVIDVRPAQEYEAGHLPGARSMPLAELEKRLADLPADKAIVAYCRGPFCVMSDEAVALLRARGFSAHKITDGVTEWAASGLPIEH